MTHNLLNQISHLLRPLRNGIANLVARAVVSLVDDAKKMQELQLQILVDEVRDGAEHFQNYGFTAHPHVGAEAVVLSVNGHRDHLLVVAVDDRRYRPKNLAAGEVQLYDDEGKSVYLKRGRIVVTAPEIRLGSDSASDFVALASKVLDRLNQIKVAFDGHTHAAGTGPTNLVAPSGGGPVTGSTAGATPMGAIEPVAAAKVKAK